jgi:hypothetical protein
MDLLKELKDRAGLSNDQAAKTLEILKEFVNGKVPVFLAGTVEKWFNEIEKKASDAAKEDDFLDS